MSDKDSVDRFERIVGFGNRRVDSDRKAGYKKMYVWYVGGFEKVQALIALLWGGLNKRRREKATKVLLEFMEYKGVAVKKKIEPDGGKESPKGTVKFGKIKRIETKPKAKKTAKDKMRIA